jgi:CheY-like chemotaxis protein
MCQNLWPDELKILVIDTDQETLNMIRYSLEPAGFRVIRTHKPQEGLELARREQPDLLLLDVTMPEYDGFELLRYIRRVPPLELIPTIVVSTRAKTVDQQRILQLCLPDQEEIDAFVGKPVDPAQLLKTVKTVLINHKQHLLHKKQQLEKMVA